MSHDEQPNLNPENTNPGWKDRDINIRIVIYATTSVFAVALATMVAMYFLVQSLNDREAYAKGAAPERILPEGDVILQVNAAGDLKTYLDNEERVLTTYGDAVDGAGHVRIPIEAAKEHMLKQGFPARDAEIPAVFHKPATPVEAEPAKPAMEAPAQHDSHEGHPPSLQSGEAGQH